MNRLDERRGLIDAMLRTSGVNVGMWGKPVRLGGLGFPQRACARDVAFLG